MHSIIIEHNWICLGFGFGNIFFSLRATEKKRKTTSTKSAMSSHDLYFHFNVRDKVDD